MNSTSERPGFTVHDYGRWRELIQEKVGHQIRETRTDFLRRRLGERMQALSIQSFGEYYDYITRDSGNQEEWKRLIELLVNCQSSFFRHPPSYEALMGDVLAGLIRHIRATGKKRPIFMWSLGCSMGQEPYSMAMAFDHVMGGGGDIPLRVMGTDISLNALLRATKGEYSYFEIGDMPEWLREKYMVRIRKREYSSSFKKTFKASTPIRDSILSKHMYRYRVKHEIRKNVRFAQRNIIKELSRPGGVNLPMQDVIFCQNVFIYFNIHDRARTVSMLLNRLRPGGYLFLAPGEAVGIHVKGAVNTRFKDTMAYKRNKESVHVRVTQ